MDPCIISILTACYPLVESIFIILYWIFIISTSTPKSSTLRFVSKQFRSNEYICLYFVLRIFKRSYLRRQSESIVNGMRIYSAQSIIFKISPVVKQFHPLSRSITCKGVVSWFSGWYWFLSNVSISANQNQLYNKIKHLLTGCDWNSFLIQPSRNSSYLGLNKRVIPLTSSENMYNTRVNSEGQDMKIERK